MKVAFYTLGCKVNIYETEVMKELFKQKNYKIVEFDKNADVYVINTCTVTNNSDNKSKKYIRRAIRNNPNAIIVVVGCLPQINKKEIENIEGVDIIIGNKDKTKIVDYINDYSRTKKQITKIYDLKNICFEDMCLSNYNNKTRAIVKIQDGCNNYCSYCIIPYVRGSIRSKKKENVISEIKKLVNNGYIEIVLTGIHTGSYGQDINEYDFADLLEEIERIEGLKRIRISSIEITEITPKVINIMKNSDKIVNHLHIPLQSGSNTVLKRMNRKYNKKYFYKKIKELKKVFNDLSITTDVIIGFPGETTKEFKETYNFIKKINFSKLHVFPYSKREGTVAAKMDNQIINNIKSDRVKKMIILSKKLEIKHMKKHVNKILEIIPEIEKDGYIIGHSSNYLMTKIKGNKNQLGKLLKIKVKQIQYPYCL
ncbi:MAG: tRNA (N(6)-L-threonylcarbamoyladenosine(37)-C(2))-methylthiotransferase MtaB, partial [Bacilli bacterium]